MARWARSRSAARPGGGPAGAVAAGRSQAGASGAASAAASISAAGSGSPSWRSSSARLRSVGQRWPQLPVRVK